MWTVGPKPRLSLYDLPLCNGLSHSAPLLPPDTRPGGFDVHGPTFFPPTLTICSLHRSHTLPTSPTFPLHPSHLPVPLRL